MAEALLLGALVFEQTSPSQFECAVNELAVNQPISSVDEIHQNALPKRDALNAVASLRLMTFETPLSGMSMNPARTFGSALHASYWHALWLYFLAPTLGMLVAAEVFLRARSSVGPYCAKLHHANNRRCIFHHGYRATEIQHF